MYVKVVALIFCYELWQGRCHGYGECGGKLMLMFVVVGDLKCLFVVDVVVASGQQSVGTGGSWQASWCSRVSQVLSLIVSPG